jgi:mono/diheme cytochrome c family protein
LCKRYLFLTVFLLAGYPAFAQQDQKPAAAAPAAAFKIPDDAVKMANPVKPTAESLARAKRTYGIDCLMCHGATGDGKGDVGADMHLKDYRDPDALRDLTDGELFYIIKNGKGDMPSEGDRAKPDEIWSLVNYIRAFAKKGTAAKEKAAAQ